MTELFVVFQRIGMGLQDDKIALFQRSLRIEYAHALMLLEKCN